MCQLCCRLNDKTRLRDLTGAGASGIMWVSQPPQPRSPTVGALHMVLQAPRFPLDTNSASRANRLRLIDISPEVPCRGPHRTLSVQPQDDALPSEWLQGNGYKNRLPTRVMEILRIELLSRSTHCGLLRRRIHTKRRQVTESLDH